MEKEVIDFINGTPEEYRYPLHYVIEFAKKCFKDNLCNLTLGGSLGKNNTIRGWSDIDLYVVLKKYNPKEVSKFMKGISTLDMHVGTTYYTLDEIDKGMIDSKTKVMCYEKHNYGLNPTLYGDNVFKEISYEEIVQNDFNNLPNILHDLRRRYIELLNSDSNKVTKTYIKKIFVLIKCILNCYGIFSYGYDYSLKQLRLLAEKEGCDLTPLDDFDIISIINNMDNAKDDVLKFSEFLLDFIEISCKKKGENKVWIKELVQEQ